MILKQMGIGAIMEIVNMFKLFILHLHWIAFVQK